MPLIRNERPDASSPGPTESADTLFTGSADERWALARALGHHPDGVAPLGRALARESDERVREAIFTSLTRHDSAASVDVILPYLRSNDANLRGGALDALRTMIATARSALPGLLADPDADVRLLACDLARGLPAAEASVLLSQVLARDGDANVCAAAVDVLAETGDSTALPFLARCAARFPDEPFLTFALRITTERILAQVGGLPPPPHE